MFGTVMGEPVLTAFERFWFLLICAGGVENVMVVNIVDSF